MSDINCSACEELRTEAPAFATNGVTSAVCASLKNDTGLSTTNGHNNDTDLTDANDCLIGRMDDELESYDVCDWKDFMHKFIPNLYEFLKAILCSLAGIWANIHSIDTNLTQVWCWLRHLSTSPSRYTIHVYEDDDPTKPAINGFRIADGVTMRQPSDTSGPITVQVLGTNIYIGGSLSFNGNMPLSYTNNVATPWSYLQHGCNALTNIDGMTWGDNGANMDILIYELQVKACDYGFSNLFGTMYLHQNIAGDFTCKVYFWRKGAKVYADYTSDPNSPGNYIYNPDDDDMILIQVRLTATRVPLRDVSPNGMGVIIACPDAWSC